MRAVFVDRDGTINIDDGNTYSTMNVRLYPNVLEGLSLFQSNGYRIIIISNQGGIEAGNYTEDQVKIYNQKLAKVLGDMGIHLSGIYYCPHNNRGKPDNERCACAKPAPGLILEAAKKHNLNLKDSWMIGDKTSDVMAGKRAGCRTILMLTGEAGHDRRCDAVPDYRAPDMLDAARFIIKETGVLENTAKSPQRR